MDDLISRKALYDAMKKREEMYAEGNCLYDAYNYHVSAEIVSNAPSVPAVPLDKLCEWLAENAEFPMEVEVKIFYEPTEEPEIKLNRMPNDAERWREKLTKWMEGQHET